MATLIEDDDLKKPAASPAAPAPAVPGAQPAKPKTGTGFTNIGRIVNANQGNKLGSTISGNIQNQASQVKQGIQGAQSQFQQQAQANRLDSAENQQKVQSVLQDPTKATDQDVQAFSQFRSGQYGGPTGLQNADQLRAQAEAAKAMGQATGSMGGRQALLQRYAGTPQYNAGQQRLDSVLLGQTGANDLRQARRATTGLTGALQSGEQAAAAQAQELQGRAQAFGQDVNAQLESKYNPMSSDLDARVKAAQDAEVARQQSLNEFRQTLQPSFNVPNAADVTRASTGQYNPFTGQRGTGSGIFDSSEQQSDQAALDSALAKGYIPKEQYDQLTSLNSRSNFVDKGQDLGRLGLYNTNQYGYDTANPGYTSIRELLNKNLSEQTANDASRASIADDSTLANLNALQRLRGGQAEFNPTQRTAYQAGSQSLNLDPILQKLQQKNIFGRY